ncbi:glycoside hydrolase family 108 protein [Stappia sp. F7233]|uniref:Glycoside hydrolase family 108 protein n=1 Tax=Stappia albiluteola TaxID=2758565 RepID=A0A839AF90_9HYPH|nr:glycoside hydrolase family 108 protein [Stappia albiluteola]MBA5777457.1 glycoside hydrolase family 108 protein [Stappia albiluteola]MBA5777495.1 glycoside hydrolase family 108 protein [Stappia albiluteola]MBA5778094.1 glycoside hydrolase family 108 protein [Stappia albiluteola]MBA5778129.1 glycoside hydrolase family 108 protein [Stappia albiluteola]
MKKNFPRSLAFTLSFEGGYVDHPKDPGGATNKGITLATLRLHKAGATKADLKDIRGDLVNRIYHDDYWERTGCDTLASGVDGAVFDYAVNSGPAAARKSLMAVIGGPDHETVRKLCARRLSIYRTFKHWATFGKGWTRRVAEGEALWTRWALAEKSDVAEVIVALEDKGSKAKGTSRQQGAAGSGAAASAPAAPVAAPVDMDALAAIAVAGVTVALIALAAWLLWRAHVNRLRARAYATQAERAI